MEPGLPIYARPNEAARAGPNAVLPLSLIDSYFESNY